MRSHLRIRVKSSKRLKDMVATAATEPRNVATVKHRSLFRYPGGKTWLVPTVLQWLRSLPAITEFAEPFAGGGIVSLSVLFEGIADFVTLVERDEDVAAVWRSLVNGDATKLATKITEFEVNESNVRELLGKEAKTPLERAFATIVRNRVQRGGILAPGAGLLKEGEKGKGLLSRWYPETLKKRIDDLLPLRSRLGFIEGDGLHFIRYSAHRPDVVFYIDPPYTVAGRRLYKYSDIDHEQLFQLAAKIKGDFLMSYDDTPEIRELARKQQFEMAAIPMKNTHHEVQRELLIGKKLSWLGGSNTSSA
jgi:DNA adenine methylase